MKSGFSLTYSPNTFGFKALCSFMSFLMLILTVTPTIQAAVNNKEVMARLQAERLAYGGGIQPMDESEMRGVVGMADDGTKVSAAKTEVNGESSETPVIEKSSSSETEPVSTASVQGTFDAPELATGGGSQSSGGSVIRNPLDGFNVDQFTGGATMSIPIEVPAGRKGMQPSIDLVYKSGAANDWCGVGWNLDMGYIVRMGALKGFPKYDATDRFFYVSNGSAMELVNTGNPETGVYEYKAKVEGGFQRFLWTKNIDIEGPLYNNGFNGKWEIYDKNGTKYYMGRSPSTRTDGYKYSTVVTYKWHLDKVQDADGNYMTFSYYKSSDMSNYQLYLQRIDYAYDYNNTNNKCYVTFTRETAPDAVPVYNAGFTDRTLRRTDRLKKIEIYADNACVNKYILDYGTSNSANSGRSLLMSVAKYDKDETTALPAITFNYSQGSDYFGNGSQSAIQNDFTFVNNSPSCVAGDFDGNGMMDIKNGISPTWNSNGEYVWLSNGSGFAGGNNWGAVTYFVVDELRGFTSGDYNGDGKTDIVYNIGKYVLDVPSYNSGRVKVGYSNSNGTGFSYTDWLSYQGMGDPYIFRVGSSHGPCAMVSGDFNGDGRSDIFISDPGEKKLPLVWQDERRNYLLLSSGNNGFTSSGSLWDEYPPYYTRYYYAGDVNGDGKSDVILFKEISSSDHRAQVYYSTGTGFSAGAEITGLNGVGQIGDFNGDGMTDICDFLSSSVKIWFSTGYGFASPVQWTPNSSPYYPIQTAGDINNDGMTDFVQYMVSSPNVDDNGMYVWFSKGNGLLYAGKQAGAYGSGPYYVYPSSPCGDVSGDGQSDLVTYTPGSLSSSTPGCAYTWLSTGGKRDQLVSISNGYGGTISIDYSPSTEYTNSVLPFAVQVVSQVTTNDGISSGDGGVHTYITDYSYSGGSYDIALKEFRGFATCNVTKTVGSTIDLITTTFAQDAIMQGRPILTEVKRDGSLINKTQRTWATKDLGNGRSFPYLLRQDDYIDPGSVNKKRKAITYVYDNNGYGTLTGVYNWGNVDYTTGDSTLETGDEISVTTSYAINTTSWIFKSAQITTKDAAGATIKDSKNYYDNHASITDAPTQGRLTKIENWLDKPYPLTNPSQVNIWPYIVYTYDNYGNTKTYTDQNGRSTTYNYDPSNTFILSKVDAKGYTYTTEYYGVNSVSQDNGLYGQVKSETDPNLVKQYRSYDAFGRQSKVWNPGDLMTSSPANEWVYNSFGTAGTQSVIKKTMSNTSQPYVTETFFDGLGRTIQVHKNNTSLSEEIRSTILYDGWGREYKKSLSYSATHPSNYEEPPTGTKWVMTEYDGLGRPVKMTNADNTYSTVAYDGYTVTKLDENYNIGNVWKRKTVFTKDAYDRLIKVEEYAQESPSLIYTTHYRYDAAGNLQWINPAKPDVAGSPDTIRFYYDSYGRKIKSHDPDRGKNQTTGQIVPWQFEYDLCGNMKRQVDARNAVITVDYDELNRIRYKYAPGLVATYTYDQGTYGKGRLTTVVDPSGTATFTYNIKGQLEGESRLLTGLATAKTIGRTYNPDGQLATLTYPDGEVVTYVYDGWGRPISATGTSTYISNATYTSISQLDVVTHGNSRITDYDYDANRLWLTDIKLGSVAHPDSIQYIHFVYDTVGNVHYKDMIPSGISTSARYRFIYEYDNLYRLVKDRNQLYYSPYTLKYEKLYSYDEVGNRKAPNNPTYSCYEGTNRLYSYDGGTTVYTYDANGNILTKGANSYTFDNENRFTRFVQGANSIDYVYNSVGLMVKKVETIYEEEGGDLIPIYNGTESDKASTVIKDGNLIVTVNNSSIYTDQPLYLAIDTDQTIGSGNLFIPDAKRTGLDAAGAWEYCLVVKNPSEYGYYEENLQYRGQAEAAKGGMTVEGSEDTYRIKIPLKLLGTVKRIAISAVSQHEQTTERDSRIIKNHIAESRESADVIYATLVTAPTSKGTIVTTQYIMYNESGQVLCEVGSDGIISNKQYYWGGQKVAERQGSTLYYTHNDQLGSMTTMTSTTGTVSCRRYYYAFGGDYLGSNLSEYRFNGKPCESSTGLYYYGARYYDTNIGKFVSCDPVLGKLENPQTLNPYVYCVNNPQTYIDPNGQFFFLPYLVSGLVSGCLYLWGAGDEATFDGFMYAFGMGVLSAGIGASVGWVGNKVGSYMASKIGSEFAGQLLGRGLTASAYEFVRQNGNVTGREMLYSFIGGAGSYATSYSLKNCPKIGFNSIASYTHFDQLSKTARVLVGATVTTAATIGISYGFAQFGNQKGLTIEAIKEKYARLGTKEGWTDANGGDIMNCGTIDVPHMILGAAASGIVGSMDIGIGWSAAIVSTNIYYVFEPFEAVSAPNWERYDMTSDMYGFGAGY